MSKLLPANNPIEIRAQIMKLVGDFFSASKELELPFRPGATHIPPAGKLLGLNEFKNMVEAALDGWLTTGRFCITAYARGLLNPIAVPMSR